MGQGDSGSSSPNPNPKSEKAAGPARKRSISGSGGLLSKFPFMRSSADNHRPRSRHGADDSRLPPSASPGNAAFPPIATSPPTASSSSPPIAFQQQQKTRRRRGSLRKVALLGRGAQRERRESRAGSPDIRQSAVPPLHTGSAGGYGAMPIAPSPIHTNGTTPRSTPEESPGGYGLGISDITPRPSMDGFSKHLANDTEPFPAGPTLAATLESAAARVASVPRTIPRQNGDGETAAAGEQTAGYSTTDDEDALHMAPRADAPSSSSSLSVSHGFLFFFFLASTLAPPLSLALPIHNIYIYIFSLQPPNKTHRDL